MNQKELCALSAIDIRTGNAPNALAEGLEIFRQFVGQSTENPGVIDISVTKKDFKVGNKFEIIGRFDDETTYLEHLASPANLGFRSSISVLLGSPYEERLHNARGNQTWPNAVIGDFVGLTQFEVDPRTLAESQGSIDALFDAQQPASGQHVVLQRNERPYNFEMLSVWESEEEFTAMVLSREVQQLRKELQSELLAPIDDRRYRLLLGAWSSP